MLIGLLHRLLPFDASSACYAAGYAVGIATFILFARQRGLATSGMKALMLTGLIGGLLVANIVQFVFTGEPGKTVLGAVAGGYLAVALMKRRMGITRSTGDMFAVAFSAGEMVGRFGCYFGGCCYGRATHVAWAIFQHGAWRHPTQLYMSAASGTILLILLLVNRHKPPENALFFLQGVLYCMSRFAIEFFRQVSPVAAGLTMAQLACLAGFVFFGWRLYATLKSPSSMQAHTHAKAPEAQGLSAIEAQP